MYRHLIKPFFDLIFSILLAMIAIPMALIAAMILICDLKANPIFSQQRPGKNEKTFKIYKLKTMTDKRNVEGHLLPDAQRLTKMGSLIRRISLDELPQLWNIVIGQMSFVGPRPLLPEYLSLYNDFQKRRHEVRPGITGWAQVNGRNAISWEEKFELDVWYVDNQSFLLDLKILWMTFLKVLKREGISSGTSVTMEKFKGTK